MRKKTLLLIAAVLVFITVTAVATYLFVLPKPLAAPSWLKEGAYMTYEQFIAWDGQNKTEYMFWDVTQFQDGVVDFHLTSHGITVDGGSVATVAGEENWTINAASREITESIDPDYVGTKCPFWIEQNAKTGSTIDILYGKAIISRAETVSVLGLQRDCWVVEYYWPSSSMKRWYDKSTGIVLKIQVVQILQGISVETTETAVQTNVVFAS